MDWPTFDAPLLRGIAAAFERRRKAIAYQAGLSCGRAFTESEAGAVERLNVEAGNVRLSIWADGAMWLAVCVRGCGRGAGWAFKDTWHGDVQDISAEALVGLVEATLALRLGSHADRERQQLRAVWERVHPHKR